MSFPQIPGLGAQFDRKQQVTETLIAISQCRALNADRSLLEVGILLRDGTTTSLRISLPPGFPRDRPAMAVTTPVRHPWVSPATGRLQFPLLEQWGSYGTRLAAVVQEALKGLGGQPTVLAGPAGPAAGSGAVHLGPLPSIPSGGFPSPSSSASGSLEPPRTEQQQQQQGSPLRRPSGPALPPVPHDFPQLRAMSDAQLLTTLCEEGAYKALLENVAASAHVTQVVDELRAGNRELAASNMGVEEALADIRNQMAIIRSTEWAPAKAAFDGLAARQAAVLAQLAPGVLIERLGAAAAAADEESALLAQQLEAGEIGLEAFAEQYVRARALFHQRDLKHQAAQATIPHSR